MKGHQRMNLSLIFAVSLASGVLLLATAALAQEATPTPNITDDQVNAIAKKMYCPVCENIPLDVCPTQACVEWRELIREKLAQGWSEEQIRQYFVDQYGPRVLAAPPLQGINWLAYFVPLIVVITGAFIFIKALRSWRVNQPQEGSDTMMDISEEDEYIRQVEDKLRQL